MSYGIDERGLVLACASCRRTNRVAYAALGKPARCGACRTPLSPPPAPIDVQSSASFDLAAASSALPLIVDFWAPWCGPCRMVAPELERVARANAGQWLIVKVNTDVHADLGSRYGVRSIPTLAVVHRGRELARMTGVRPAAEIERFVREALNESARRVS